MSPLWGTGACDPALGSAWHEQNQLILNCSKVIRYLEMPYRRLLDVHVSDMKCMISGLPSSGAAFGQYQFG
jgi:hypothetical protein